MKIRLYQHHEIPFTNASDAPRELRAQREYVECQKLGIGFAAHDNARLWHYRFAQGKGDAVCATLEVDVNGDETLVRAWFNKSILEWLDEARRQMPNVVNQLTLEVSCEEGDHAD